MRLARTRLLRWLGPWAEAGSRPAGVSCRVIRVAGAPEGERPLTAWVYAPTDRAPIGSYVVCPGLHPDGPADRRLDRFLRILAHAGYVSTAPFLRDYTRLVIAPRVIDDLEATLRTHRQLPEVPPGKTGLFSISLGSLPALRVAASTRWADSVQGLISFGGYADLAATLRYTLGERSAHCDAPACDPLSLPAVFLNLLWHLDQLPADPSRVVERWRWFISLTWGQPELKRRERYEPIARRLARDLCEEEAQLFLLGCGLQANARQTCLEALPRWGPPAFTDPRPHLSGLRCRVRLAHGRSDDVIPYSQLAALAAAMPSGLDVRQHLTGLYNHTGMPGPGELVQLLPSLLSESRTLLALVEALVECGSASCYSPARHE